MDNTGSMHTMDLRGVAAFPGVCIAALKCSAKTGRILVWGTAKTGCSSDGLDDYVTALLAFNRLQETPVSVKTW